MLTANESAARYAKLSEAQRAILGRHHENKCRRMTEIKRRIREDRMAPNERQYLHRLLALGSY